MVNYRLRLILGSRNKDPERLDAMTTAGVKSNVESGIDFIIAASDRL